MLEKIKAVVVAAEGRFVIIAVAGFELRIIANAAKFSVDNECELRTYLHWNQETGPVLFGFATELEKQAFKILIDCPKIGPALAMNILVQVQPHELFNLICKENEKALAKINGVGPKCAKNLIAFVREKAKLFLQTFTDMGDGGTGQDMLLIDVREALLSLGYSGSEVSRVFCELEKNDIEKPFDQVLRRALQYLQKK
jgi:Holliday junction DNA helicase RuvA